MRGKRLLMGITEDSFIESDIKIRNSKGKKPRKVENEMKRANKKFRKNNKKIDFNDLE